MRWKWLIFVALTALSCFALIKCKSGDDVYIFKGLSGPKESSVLLDARNAQAADFSDGSESRLAILLTDSDSSWLGLAHGFKSIGIPFIITTDYHRALKHKVVFVYPTVSGKVLPKDALQALASFARDGGTLMAQNVLGGGMSPVFGFDEAVPSLKNVHLKITQGLPMTVDLTEPEEAAVPISTGKKALTGAYAYTNPRLTPIATYEDGTAAITQKNYEKGKAYAFGLDLGHLLLKGYNNRQESISKNYANHYSPTLDVLLRLTKNIYVAGQGDAVTLSTVPFGKKLAVILTHDVDYSRSLRNALEYASFEKRHGINGTYFIQTKYVRDWNDVVFFDKEGAQIVNRLQNDGADIASHSVAHSRIFSKFANGNGREQYPSYAPVVKSRFECENCTILGELRVSKFLLEQSMSGRKVASFRPGHLENPYALPESLVATGFRYSSSVTANDSLTHLPFRLNYNRDVKAETSIFEFPITIEDEADPPMIARLPQAIELARKLKRYGGLFNILIHPDELGQKLEFESGFVEAMGDSAWYGSLKQFGDWWKARDDIALDVVTQKNGTTVKILTRAPIAGITLNIPPGLHLKSSQPSALSISQSGSQLVINHLEGQAELQFTRL